MNAYILNAIIIPLALTGFYLSFRHVRWQIIIYYTEIANCIALVSSIMYLIDADGTAVFRYASTCMLTMTSLVSLLVLSPSDGGIKKNMFEGECLYQHTLIPLISLISYIFMERHCDWWYIPVIVTFAYGMLMVFLNIIRKVDGPYDFLKIRKNGIRSTIIWIAVLLLVITLISVGIMYCADLNAL